MHLGMLNKENESEATHHTHKAPHVTLTKLYPTKASVVSEGLVV